MSQPSLQFGKSLFLIPSPQGDHGLLYVRHHGTADRDSVLVVQHQPGTIQLLDVVEVYKKGPVRKDKAGIVDFGKQLFDPPVVLEITLAVRDDLDAALHLLDIEDILIEDTGIILIVLHHNRTGIRFFQGRKGLLQSLWQSVLQIQFGDVPQGLHFIPLCGVVEVGGQKEQGSVWLELPDMLRNLQAVLLWHLHIENVDIVPLSVRDGVHKCRWVDVRGNDWGIGAILKQRLDQSGDFADERAVVIAQGDFDQEYLLLLDDELVGAPSIDIIPPDVVPINNHQVKIVEAAAVFGIEVAVIGVNPLFFFRHGNLDLLHHFVDGSGVIFCGRPSGHGHADVLRGRAQDSFRLRGHLKDHADLFFRKPLQFGVELQDPVKVKPHLAEQPEEGKRLIP